MGIASPPETAPRVDRTTSIPSFPFLLPLIPGSSSPVPPSRLIFALLKLTLPDTYRCIQPGHLYGVTRVDLRAP